MVDPIGTLHPARRESFRVDTTAAPRRSYRVDTTAAPRRSYRVDTTPAARRSYRVDTAPAVQGSFQVDESPVVRESYRVDTTPVVRESYRVGAAPAAAGLSYRVDTRPAMSGPFPVDTASPASGRSFQVARSSSGAVRSYRVDTSSKVALRSYRVDTSPADFASPETAERGTLTIAPKVFERIAAVAATEVRGVAPAHGNHASQLLGRGMPRASAELAGSHVHLDTTVPLRWPSTAPDVAAAVREHVGSRVSTLTGRTVDRVDVDLGDTVRTGGRVRVGAPVVATPAPVPTGPAAAAVVGILVPLLLIGIGAIAVRDALISAGSVGGGALLPRAGRWVAGITPGSLVLGLSIAAVVVGLLFLLFGLKRRSRPDLVLDSAVPVYLRPGDVARVAASAADQVDGVLGARATAGSARVRVSVSTTGQNQQIADAVTAEVSQAVRAVRTRRRGSAPAVTTTMRSS